VRTDGGRGGTLRVADLVGMPLRTLAKHPLQAGLGVLIAAMGVGLTVALCALLLGLEQSVVEQIERSGARVLVVMGAFQEGDQAELEALPVRPRSVVPATGFPCIASAGGREAPALVVGTTPAYVALFRFPLAAGRFLTDEDAGAWPPRCVLDGALARRLFGGEQAVGRSVTGTLGDVRVDVEVVGVLRDLADAYQVGLYAEVPQRQVYAHLQSLAPMLRGRIHALLLEAPAIDDLRPLHEAVQKLAASLRQADPPADGAPPRWYQAQIFTEWRTWIHDVNRDFQRMMNGLGLGSG